MSPTRVRWTRWSETLPITVTVMAGSPPAPVLSEYDRQCRTPSISTPIRAHWPASWACQPRPGRKVIVAESVVSATIPVTMPRAGGARTAG